MRLAIAGVLACTALLAGCQSSIDGTATKPPDSFAEPDFPTPRPSRPPRHRRPPRAASVDDRAGPPGGEVLQPQNGVVFIETKSGKTRCQINEQEVGCEAAFANAPESTGCPPTASA